MPLNLHICIFANLHIDSVGRSGFEPLKSKDSGFTVRPIWPLWNLPVINLKLPGAREGTRTPDQLITNQLLYQLSYSGLQLE